MAGAPFGVAEREPVRQAELVYPAETPVATAPAHRFVAHTSIARGLAVLAPGFFEYELTPTGELVLTLFRAIGQLSRANLSTRPGHAGGQLPRPTLRNTVRTGGSWPSALSDRRIFAMAHCFPRCGRISSFLPARSGCGKRRRFGLPSRLGAHRRRYRLLGAQAGRER